MNTLPDSSSLSTSGPRPGAGVRLTANEAGFAFSVPTAPGRFAHPFTPLLGGSSLKFSRGLVDGRDVTIGALPLEGRAQQPSLKLTADKATAAGESWAVLEVEPDDATGVLLPTSRREIVHSDTTTSLERTLGRWPIAMILWANGKPLRALPIVWFNLGYQRVIPGPGAGPVRHLFL